MKKNPIYVLLWLIFPIAIILDTLYRCVVAVISSLKNELIESFSLIKSWATWYSKEGK